MRNLQDEMPPPSAGNVRSVAPSAVTPSKADELAPEVERQKRIELVAYYRAEQRGFAPGMELDDWLSAEAGLDANGEADTEVQGVGGGKDAQPREAPAQSHRSS